MAIVDGRVTAALAPAIGGASLGKGGIGHT
jgi:hypothetical protein